MSNWKKYKLSEVVEIKYGKDHKHLANGKIPLYGSGGIMRFVDTALYTKESILIPRKGTLSNLFYTNIPFWSVDTMFYTKIKSGNNGKYLYYLLKSIDLASMNVGSAVPSLTTEVLNKIEITIPESIEVQNRIASILSALDDKIELNRKTNETLEQIAQTLFKKYFVDNIDPDNLPEGWNNDSLDSIADFLNGIALQKYRPQNENNYLPVIKIKELKNGISSTTEKADINIPQKYIIEDGDVLFSWSGSLEVDLWCEGRGALNQHIFKVYSDKYPKWFYYLWTKEHLEEFKKTAASKATTMGHIQRHHLTEAKVFLPPTNVIEKYDLTIAAIVEKIISNRIENRRLVQIRDTLLPKLMSGEIEV